MQAYLDLEIWYNKTCVYTDGGEMLEELDVVIENIVFQAADGTFSVFRARNKINGKIAVVYRGIPPFVGEQVRINGEWIEHPKFGRQFKAVACSTIQPTSATGMERFLASGAISGIGKAMAQRIVEKFGAETMEVLGKTPQRLEEVSGIGKKKAEVIAASYAELSEMKELMLFLEEHSISSNYAPRIQAKYGNTAVKRIEDNPYCLASDISGIGFKTADRLAQSLGVKNEDKERVKAGMEFALNETASAGNTCVPEEKLLAEATRLLQITPEAVYRVYQELIKNDLLRTEDFAGTRLVYPEYLFRAETNVAHRLNYLKDKVNELWQVDYQSVIENWEQETNLKLADAQIEAIKASLEHGVFVLTGGPGTGKTTVVKGILSVLEKTGCKILLAAPTGRAARRLAESAGKPAATVHRMLEYTPNGEQYFFGRNEETPLEADAVIIDEASMLDINLANYLLKAIPVGCRLIFVGDVDQLPSVGPGTFLKDIIKSKAVPVVRLQHIFRQAALSPIVVNAHRINKGMSPLCDPNSDFSFVEITNEENAAKFIVQKYVELVQATGWEEVQVLAPMHKNPCGVMNLNKMLQDKINPLLPGKPEVIANSGLLRLGDKVMQIRNNYEKDVFNGDIGKIIRMVGRTITVAYPERLDGENVEYAPTELDELQLAYAMSVHKSQGSEYNSVIMPLVPSHYIMLQRNLFYTGITRAKKTVVLVGAKTAVNTAVGNDNIRKRYSLLSERMQDEQNLI